MNPLESVTSLEDFRALIQKNIGEEKEVDIEKLRYAIYVRKSTDTEDNQARSIEDQLSACKKFAEDNKMVILPEDIIEERESAKESGIRPKFKALMKKIIAGELDGILAWHPNRLSRNMRESGEIIDLLDKNIIKDLKFVSHVFVNDGSGKMLLGIVFVMAKQYSDQLSVDVKRGIEKSIESGAYINKSKHGYRKDGSQRMYPDGDNFVLIKECFQMRLRGDTLKKIAKFLNDSGYTRTNAVNGKTIQTKVTQQTLVEIFRDTVYTGILKYSTTVVNLVELYGFIPMITVEEYSTINKHDKYTKKFVSVKSKKNLQEKVADFLSDRVYCSKCGVLTQANINKGKTKKYYNFKCTTLECERYGKSTRAKVLVNFVIDFLDSKPFTSKKAYSSYKQEIVHIQNSGLSGINSQINGARRKLGLDSENIERVKSNLAKETDSDMVAIQKAELKRLENEIFTTEKLMAELEAKKTNVSKAPLTFEEFTIVMDAVVGKIKRVRSTTELNAIISKMFSNFVVSGKKVENYKLKSPFDTLFETKISHCAG